MNYKLVLLTAAITVPVFLSGCNTAKGFGMDLEDLGRVIQGKDAAHTQTRVRKSSSTSSQYSTSGTQYSAPATTSTSVTRSSSSIPIATTTPVTTGTVVDQQVQYSTGSTSGNSTQVYTYPYTESGATTVQQPSSNYQ